MAAASRQRAPTKGSRDTPTTDGAGKIPGTAARGGRQPAGSGRYGAAQLALLATCTWLAFHTSVWIQGPTHQQPALVWQEQMGRPGASQQLRLSRPASVARRHDGTAQPAHGLQGNKTAGLPGGGNPARSHKQNRGSQQALAGLATLRQEVSLGPPKGKGSVGRLRAESSGGPPVATERSAAALPPLGTKPAAALPADGVPRRTAAPAHFGKAPLTSASAEASPPAELTTAKVAEGRALPVVKERQYGKQLPLQDLTGQVNLLYGSYFGSAGDDLIKAAAAASNSRGIWIVGTTTGDLATHSKSKGSKAHRGRMASGAGADGFVAHVGPGGEVISVVYIGGSGTEDLCGVTPEGPDGIWVVGSTTSPDLPTRVNTRGQVAAQDGPSGGGDVFVANLKSTGELRYLTYLGGTAADTACAVSRGREGQVWVGGATQSTDMPTTATAAMSSRGGGGSDGFVASIGRTSGLEYLSYISGQAGSDGVTALLASPGSGSPQQWLGGYLTLPGALAMDALVARLSPTGHLQTEVLTGGGGRDRVAALSYDPWDGTVVACGETTSEQLRASTPKEAAAVRVGFLEMPQKLHADAFVSKFLPDGTLHSSMVLEGDRDDIARAAAVAAGGALLWVAGLTTSTDLTSGGSESPGSELEGRTDGFLAKVDMRSWQDGGRIHPLGMYYLGGSGSEDITSVVAGADGTMWVVGSTDSGDLETTADAARRHPAGRQPIRIAWDTEVHGCWTVDAWAPRATTCPGGTAGPCRCQQSGSCYTNL